METSYNHQEQEKRLRLWWTHENIYAADLTSPQLVTIDTPPPTVSGSLHIGHIFSYTQTDIIARFVRMNGNEVWYPFGFDDNGLPTERFVEKKRGIVAHHMTRSSFIQACLDETEGVEEMFRDLWQRIGLSVDWRYCYSTIDAQTRRISQLSFMRLYEKGHIYRRDEPALYCTSCRTTVAQAELDDSEQKTTFYDIAFAREGGQDPVIVATTRPELLPACVAVLFHPDDIRYQLLRGTKVRVPLFDYEVPVFADDQVIRTKGTGLVMVCTFGDTTDIAWYKKHALPYRPAIGPDGRWLIATGILAGKKVTDARETVVAALRDAGVLKGSRETVHTVNVHERCKQPIEFLVIPQWFLKILPYKDQFLKAADAINWYPAFMKSRYVNWVENITWDWCLSRQRFFGIPFPVWHCNSCQAVLLPQENSLPVDPQEMPWEGNCTQCGSGPVIPDRDVMDTWNTSSLTPYLCAALQNDSPTLFDVPFTPMSIRPQAHDIIRTWAFDTIVKVWLHHATIPWKDIVISGHVVSGSGDKLSKSKGNSALEPEALLARYPADAIRYWTASGSLGQDVAFSEQQIKLGSRLVVKLWNACRFIEEHSSVKQMRDSDSSDSTVLSLAASDAVLHRWMATRLTECYEKYSAYFKNYEFGLALQVAESCFWHDFCDNYVEIIKDQFFKSEQYPADVVAATRLMLAKFGLQFLQLFAPFLPYVTETIYGELYRSIIAIPSLHRTHFSLMQQSVHDEHAVRVMGVILHILGKVRRLKTEAQLSLRAPMSELIIYGSQEQSSEMIEQQVILQGITRAERISFVVGQGTDSLEERAGEWHMSLILEN
jgi:valyl-tRNA synthetase